MAGTATPGAIEDAFGIDVTIGQNEKHYRVQAGVVTAARCYSPAQVSARAISQRPASSGKPLRFGCSNAASPVSPRFGKELENHEAAVAQLGHGQSLARLVARDEGIAAISCFRKQPRLGARASSGVSVPDLAKALRRVRPCGVRYLIKNEAGPAGFMRTANANQARTILNQSRRGSFVFPKIVPATRENKWSPARILCTASAVALPREDA
jgi:hypothetical protein